MSLDKLLAELDERYIARRIGIPHDEARMRYHYPPIRSEISTSLVGRSVITIINT